MSLVFPMPFKFTEKHLKGDAHVDFCVVVGCNFSVKMNTFIPDCRKLREVAVV